MPCTSQWPYRTGSTLPVEPVHVRGIQEVVLLFVAADVLHDVRRHGLEVRRLDVRLVADKTVVLRCAVTVRVVSVLIHLTLCHYTNIRAKRLVLNAFARSSIAQMVKKNGDADWV